MRCVACERVGVPMNKEHIWPLWLINHAKVHKEGIRWMDKRISPKNLKFPLCTDCNSEFGAKLEQPAKTALEKIESGQGITDEDADILIRWLWKFEGLWWSYVHPKASEMKYSDIWTLKERVLGNAIDRIRGLLTLAIGLIHENDDGFEDWPLGIDSGVSDNDSVFVSAVFGRTALMVSYSRYDYAIPACLGSYILPWKKGGDAETVLMPPVCFPKAGDAISVIEDASNTLKFLHEQYALSSIREQKLKPIKPKIIIPERNLS